MKAMFAVFLMVGFSQISYAQCLSVTQAKAKLLSEVLVGRNEDEIFWALEREFSEENVIGFLDSLKIGSDSQYHARQEFMARSGDEGPLRHGTVLGRVACDGRTSVVVSIDHD